MILIDKIVVKIAERGKFDKKMMSTQIKIDSIQSLYFTFGYHFHYFLRKSLLDIFVSLEISISKTFN